MENPYRNSLLAEETQDQKGISHGASLRFLGLELPGSLGFIFGLLLLVGGLVNQHGASPNGSLSAVLVGLLCCGFGLAWLQASRLWARERTSHAKISFGLGILALLILVVHWLSLT